MSESIVIKNVKVEELEVYKDYVLVEPDPIREATESGIILLEETNAERNKNADGDLRWATVLEVGPDTVSLKKGKRVPMMGNAFPITVEGKEYVLLQEKLLLLGKKD